MNITKMLKVLLTVITIMLITTACSNNTKKDILIEIGKDPYQVKTYRAYMKNLVKEIENNQPDYKHLPLTVKDDFDWFYIQTYSVWEKSTSKKQFIQNGLQRYPEYSESLEYLADQLIK